MMLKDKVAVIYGAGGAIGGASHAPLRARGPSCFSPGACRAPVEAVAKDIVSTGGSAEAAEVDALDEQAVDKHLQSVIDKAGRVDISFNAVGIPDAKILGVPLVELDVEQFSLPIATYARSYFLTARLAARRMVANKSGVIMTVTTQHSRTGIPLSGGYGPAMAAEEALTRDALRRARTAGHSRGRSATTGHTGDRHDQGSLRASRQGIGNDLGTVAGDARKQDPRATADDARGDGERGGLHGFR